MAVYRETDGDIVREYAIQEGKPLVQIQGLHAFLEMIPTKAFGWCLFLNNELQFAEADEYMYHEALVHPCLAVSNEKTTVCILGGGDGCAARELLKWPQIETVDIFDWDSNVTTIFQEKFACLNNGSLQNQKVHLHHVNVRECIHETRSYDCILVDLLDPDLSDPTQLDLWYDVFFLIKNWTRPRGSVVINLGGILPGHTESIHAFTQFLQHRVGLPYRLYKVFVPSFAREWCFAILGTSDTGRLPELPLNLRWLTEAMWNCATTWSPDFLTHLNPISTP